MHGMRPVLLQREVLRMTKEQRAQQLLLAIGCLAAMQQTLVIVENRVFGAETDEFDDQIDALMLGIKKLHDALKKKVGIQSW